MRGADMLSLNRSPLSPQELTEVERALSLEGLVLDDLAYGFAGRWDVDRDPPYSVLAYRFGDTPAEDLPRDLGVDNPPVPGAWTESVVGGKPVLVGTEAMVDQTSHARGKPYVYNSGTVRFVIVTAEEAWAADVLKRLK